MRNGIETETYADKCEYSYKVRPVHISKQLRLDVEKHTEQYPGVTLHKYTKAHDRFLIIDDEVFHIRASLKDLGKKLFAFSKMEVLTASELLARL